MNTIVKNFACSLLAVSTILGGASLFGEEAEFVPSSLTFASAQQAFFALQAAQGKEKLPFAGYSWFAA